MKRMNLWMTVVILAFGLTATSCTEYIVNTEDNPVTPTVPTTPLTFQEQLEAIDGISDITVEKTKNGTDAYHFFVDQLIDHNDPGKGTFKQRVAMTYKGAGHTTVLYTEGYMMGSNGKNIRWTDLYDQYDANTIEVEHRYFGDINETDNDGQTALHLVCTSSTDPKTIELLLEYGADRNIRDNFCMTLLHCAAENDDSTMLRYILEHHYYDDVNDIEYVLWGEKPQT